jgi:hypothetical protein
MNLELEKSRSGAPGYWRQQAQNTKVMSEKILA